MPIGNFHGMEWVRRFVAGDGTDCRSPSCAAGGFPSLGPPRTTSTPEASVGRWGSFWKPGQGLIPVADTAEPASSYMHMGGAYGSRIPEPLPEDQPSRPPRDNGPRRYPAKPGGDRGRPDPDPQPARQPHITPLPEPEIPDVPAGLLICLLPGEWALKAGAHPDDQVTMRVAAVHPDRPRTNMSMVWVTGHGLECSWPSSTCTKPCFELLVSVEALWRAVDR